MTCALFTIGTELTRGELHNTNSGWIAEQLSELGYEVTEMVTVDDDDPRIESTLKRLAQNHDFVITTGGLGPTTDDRTSACAASAFGLSLVRDEKALASIRALFLQYGVEMSISNEKQADFPAGATVLLNSIGTAPGFMLNVVTAQIFFTPGVPSEMKAMFQHEIVPRLPPVKQAVATARLRCFGIPESQVNDKLEGVEQEHGVIVGYRASHAEIEVKILAHARDGESREALKARAEEVADVCALRLGDVVYGRGFTSLPAELGQLLRAQAKTLGLAESCTGGLVSELVTSVSGSSAYFHGSIVSYSNTVKNTVLGVPEAMLQAEGAVSESVVRAMAEGARRTLGTDVALAISGIAGPTGGTEGKPVGLVHWAVSDESGTHAFQRVFRGDRAQVQRRAALSGIWTLRKLLLGRLTEQSQA